MAANRDCPGLHLPRFSTALTQGDQRGGRDNRERYQALAPVFAVQRAKRARCPLGGGERAPCGVVGWPRRKPPATTSRGGSEAAGLLCVGQYDSFADTKVVGEVPTLDSEVPAGVGLLMTDVGSTTAIGWTEMFMLFPSPSASVTVTPTNPMML